MAESKPKADSVLHNAAQRFIITQRFFPVVVSGKAAEGEMEKQVNLNLNLCTDQEMSWFGISILSNIECVMYCNFTRCLQHLSIFRKDWITSCQTLSLLVSFFFLNFFFLGGGHWEGGECNLEQNQIRCTKVKIIIMPYIYICIYIHTLIRVV